MSAPARQPDPDHRQPDPDDRQADPDDRQPDPDALRYETYWQPVLAGAVRRLLDRLADRADERLVSLQPARTFLDVGTGTGSLALAAAARWPESRVVGLDASAGMLSVARLRGPDRCRWLVADAAAMPLESSSVDVAASAFVLQLVADRRAVLREVRRVLRPAGVHGFVTWIAEEVAMAADVEFDEAVHDLELDDPEPGFRAPKAGDYEDLDEAHAELSDAGFVDIDARTDELRFSWSRDAYLDFKVAYDERDLFESLAAADRERLRSRVRQRWRDLPDDAFSLRATLVSALARRPG